MMAAKNPLPREAFEELAMPLFDSLYNLARWLTRDQSEAEDLVQETYTKALRGWNSFESGTNLRAWMFRILRNAFLNSRTGLQAAKTVPLEDDWDVPVPGTPETQLLQQLDVDTVQNAIEKLPLHFREVILLREVEEMAYDEIALALSIPIGTVMSRLSRARGMLRDLLTERAEVKR